MQFSRLKLNGFKSFVDPTELLIEPGLTGIVGPNGCGKSNLVEALRWVMGENSAKQIRGNEMDDVIFSGTSSRPPRNSATVELHLENPDRNAPAEYNDGNPLLVSRHIQRGAGSAYRINSKEVRARDLQLLFADASSGARSTAIVSQGQIGAVINAKPDRRRHLLEEAAGITGLRSRRHEAELRLQAAEGNVGRLDDVLVALRDQLQGLRRQARQASRYRSLSGRIRKAEAMLLYSRWLKSDLEVEETSAQLSGIERTVVERARKATQKATDQANAASVLPDLRRNESKAAVQVQRLSIESERLDEEARRVEELAKSLTSQISVILADIEREKTLHGEAATRLANLTMEAEELASRQSDKADLIERAVSRVTEARKLVDDQEARVAAITEQMAAGNISRAGLQQKQSALSERLLSLNLNSEETIREKETIEGRCSVLGQRRESQETDALRERAERLRVELNEAAEVRTVVERELGVMQSDERKAAQELADVSAKKTKLLAEIEALTEAINSLSTVSRSNGLKPSVFEETEIVSGYEPALSAALGDDLSASLDQTAPASWRLVEPEHPTPSLPHGARSLSEFVKGPKELLVRLGQIGVVDNFQTGQRLANKLMYGQRLVSTDGDMWRWDGYSVTSKVLASRASPLRQRNRLQQLKVAVTEIESRHARLSERHNLVKKSLEAGLAKATEARHNELEGRQASLAADQALAVKREERAEVIENLAKDRARLEVLKDLTRQIRSETEEENDQLARIQEQILDFPDPDEETAALREERTDLGGLRRKLETELRAQEKIIQEQETRSERIAAIDDEASAWRQRDEGAESQVESLISRHKALTEQYDHVSAQPAQLKARREALLELTGEAEETRKTAADEVADAEAYLQSCERILKEANGELAASRESRARIEGKRDQAVALRAVETTQIHERLNCEPQGALELTELKSSTELPELGALEKQVERLFRERENMGAVNLRAEEEASELSVQIDTLESERTDLMLAIARLRNGITTLNREGRHRLLEAFEQVNGHFEALFVRLFGGGKAKLALIGDDDPLEAGLEIMASPPGKRLQALSLLSGGEKALAALALLFAVFLTKPAPICVLDEVDAPLDDANVERFCSLVHEIAGQRRTRFLVITHHRLTMAQMDRLFGVTMSENGVSHLVSVDLSGMGQLKAAE